MARKWEYYIEDIQKLHKSVYEGGPSVYSGIDCEKLDQLGASGWELVCIHSDGMTGVFKRLVEK